jgi:hypothetical protein
MKFLLKIACACVMFHSAAGAMGMSVDDRLAVKTIGGQKRVVHTKENIEIILLGKSFILPISELLAPNRMALNKNEIWEFNCTNHDMRYAIELEHNSGVSTDKSEAGPRELNFASLSSIFCQCATGKTKRKLESFLEVDTYIIEKRNQGKNVFAHISELEECDTRGPLEKQALRTLRNWYNLGTKANEDMDKLEKEGRVVVNKLICITRKVTIIGQIKLGPKGALYVSLNEGELTLSGDNAWVGTYFPFSEDDPAPLIIS